MQPRRIGVVVVLGVAAVAAGVVAFTAASRGDDAGQKARPTTTTSGGGAGSTTTAAGSASPSSTTAPGATGGSASANGDPGLPSVRDGHFSVVGRTIVDPSGNVFVPMGANVAVRQGQYEEGYAFNWNGTATGHVADVEAWGWNTVRATLVCLPVKDGPTAEEIAAGLDAFITEYTAKRIVVMVECHDITGDDLGPTSPKVQQILAFFDRVANRWKDNPYVWFNMFNESQASTDKAGVANWMSLQSTALRQLRAVAPTAMFVADLPGQGQGLQTLTGDQPVTRLGAGKCNVIYGWHAYGAVGKDGTFGNQIDYDNEAVSRENHRAVFEYLKAHEIPMVIGELGDPLTLDEGTAGQPIWNRIGAFAVMDLAPTYGVGLIWWHGTGDSGVFLTYSLMADRHQPPWSAATTGEGLSTAGRKFWDVSKAQAAAPKVPFTGDLKASHCG